MSVVAMHPALRQTPVVTPDLFRGPRRRTGKPLASCFSFAAVWTPEQVQGDGVLVATCLPTGTREDRP